MSVVGRSPESELELQSESESESIFFRSESELESESIFFRSESESVKIYRLRLRAKLSTPVDSDSAALIVGA